MGAAAIPAGIGAAGGLLNSKSANRPRTTTSTSQLLPFGGAAPLEFIQGQAFQNFFNPPEVFEGEIPDWSPGAGFGAAMDAFTRLASYKGWSPKKYKASDLWHTGKDWITEILTTDAAENPYLQEHLANLRADMEESFLETQAPQVASAYNIGGRTGSGMAELGMATARNEFLEDVGAMETGLMNQAFADYLDTQTAAAGLGGQYEGLLVNAYQAFNQAKAAAEAAKVGAWGAGASGLGQLAMGSGNAAYDSAMQRYMIEKGLWDQEQNMPRQQLADLYNFVVPIASQFGTQRQTSTSPGAGINPFGAMLMGGAGGYLQGRGAGMGGKGGPSNLNTLDFAPGGIYNWEGPSATDYWASTIPIGTNYTGPW